MGCELSASMREVRVSRTDDEKELDRRNFLKCMAWVGTGAVWTLSSGILKGSPLGQSAGDAMMSHGDAALRFVQISDRFTAPHAGRYEIARSELCGSGHQQMKAAIVSVAATPMAN